LSPDPNILLQGFVRALVRRKAGQLVGVAGYGRQDVPDLGQELCLRLLQSLSRFDPARGRIEAFVTIVLERTVARLVRDRRTKKRYAPGSRSLDAPDAEADGLLPEDYRQAGDDARDLRADLDQVLEPLPPEQRDLARRLMERTIADVARDLGVPRSTLMRRVGHLRRHLEDAGLRDYRCATFLADRKGQ
jgi:RNA polymerase sigma-70 factor (ECF subfamily)